MAKAARPAPELQRLREEMARARPRERLRIVIAGDPRRPLRSIAIPSRLPVVALGGALALVLIALGLAVAWYLLRGSVGRLETRVSAMAEAADQLARHPLPDPAVTALDEGVRVDVPLRATVRPERAVPPGRLERFLVESVNTGEQVQVSIDGATGEADERSYRALRRLMRCLRTGAETPIDPRLIELLAAISRRTGQKIVLVSGFRAPMFSTAALSYHTRGMAADIRIPGMTPLMVRDLVMSMGVTGVGYYPVSQFVHVDVRDRRAYWVDSGAAREESETLSHSD